MGAGIRRYPRPHAIQRLARSEGVAQRYAEFAGRSNPHPVVAGGYACIGAVDIVHRGDPADLNLLVGHVLGKEAQLPDILLTGNPCEQVEDAIRRRGFEGIGFNRDVSVVRIITLEVEVETEVRINRTHRNGVAAVHSRLERCVLVKDGARYRRAEVDGIGRSEGWPGIARNRTTLRFDLRVADVGAKRQLASGLRREFDLKTTDSRVDIRVECQARLGRLAGDGVEIVDAFTRGQLVLVIQLEDGCVDMQHTRPGRLDTKLVRLGRFRLRRDQVGG